MAIRIRSLSGLGALSGVPAMKAALNALDRQTGNTGRFNAGPEDQNLSGDAGWHVIKATVNLIKSAGKTAGDAGDLAAALIGTLSSHVGDALSFAGTQANAAAAFAGDVLGYMTGDIGYLVWTADQTIGKKYLSKFLTDASGAITSLAGAYLAVLKAGASSGVAPTSSTTPDSGHTFRIDRPEFRVASHAVTGGQQVVFNEDTTPIRPSLAKPTLVIGGAVAVAAAILLLR